MVNIIIAGSFDEAREVLKKSEDFLPDYVLLRIHRIALEVRQKNTSAAEELYKDSIASCRHWDREARCFWVCRYARFMSQVRNLSCDVVLYKTKLWVKILAIYTR